MKLMHWAALCYVSGISTAFIGAAMRNLGIAVIGIVLLILGIALTEVEMRSWRD